MAASMLIGTLAYLQPECPYAQIPGAEVLGPVGWIISLSAALFYAALGERPGKRRCAWAALAGILLSATGNFHTLQPFSVAYVALLLLYAHAGRAGLNAGLAGMYLLAGAGKLNPRFPVVVPGFFAGAWAHDPFDGALLPFVFFAVLISPLLELLTAALLVTRPRQAALLMFALHSGVLVCLTRLHWGPVVWAWNLQLLLLAAAALWETPATTVHRPRAAAWGLGVAALVGLPYTLGYSDLPTALPLYTGNINRLILRLPGGELQDAGTEAILKRNQGLSGGVPGLLDYAACQRRLGNVTSARIVRRWSFTSGGR